MDRAGAIVGCVHNHEAHVEERAQRNLNTAGGWIRIYDFQNGRIKRECEIHAIQPGHVLNLHGHIHRLVEEDLAVGGNKSNRCG